MFQYCIDNEHLMYFMTIETDAVETGVFLTGLFFTGVF